ncbi:MAG TPA: hypothetical protein PLU81_11685 [Deltaproteobacteria bacterium]|nr:hypothetical protein [Deltaproteobacteria bacterium]
MEKISIIQDYCADIIQCPWTSEETMNHLVLAADLAGYSYLDKTAQELAEYIRTCIPFCSRRVMDDVYFLLIDMANILDN